MRFSPIGMMRRPTSDPFIQSDPLPLYVVKGCIAEKICQLDSALDMLIQIVVLGSPTPRLP